jgi:hypothetical protein
VESFVPRRAFVLGDGSAIVGKTVCTVAKCPATTGGTVIIVLVVEFPNLTGVARGFVFPGGRRIVAVGTVPVAVVPVLGGLETLF